jgi:hypothetical protein
MLLKSVVLAAVAALSLATAPARAENALEQCATKTKVAPGTKPLGVAYPCPRRVCTYIFDKKFCWCEQ